MFGGGKFHKKGYRHRLYDISLVELVMV